MARAPLKHAAKELGSVVAAVLCLLAVSIVTAFANAGLDPSKLFTVENITNMCLNAATTIFGIIVAIPLGAVLTKQLTTPNGSPGRYMATYAAYTKIRNIIEPKRLAFSQWHHKQHLKEQYEKCLNHLLAHNIEQATEVMKLSREQILQLTTSQKFTVDGVELYFKALTHEQIRACNDVLSGRIVVHKLPDFYFLYPEGSSATTFYDAAYRQHRDDAMFLIVRLFYKIFIGFVITSIFTSLVISKVSDDIATRVWVIKTLVTIFARMFNAVSSVYWGYQIGQEQVYRQCYYISGKTQFLELFNADTGFVPKSLQEIAKEDYEAEKGDVTNDVQN